MLKCETITFYVTFVQQLKKNILINYIDIDI